MYSILVEKFEDIIKFGTFKCTWDIKSKLKLSTLTGYRGL
jgi:hypothetical protein